MESTLKIIQFSYKPGKRFQDIAADRRNTLMCNLKVVPGRPSRKGPGRDHVTGRQVEGGESVVGCIVNPNSNL